jgi:mono/diheme cytochrome c family protein
MREHFKDTETIRAAVIHGPLSNAVVPARALVDLAGSGHMPDNWKRWAERVKEISVRISASPDVSATAAATADIGVTCGGCHRGGGGPKLKLGQPPALGTTLASRMARHAWATERLWEGLYAPSDAAWKAGAAALEGSEFPAEILKQGGVHARSAATRFAAVVAKAKDQKTPEDRAAAYGSLIETCASCHIALGKSH